MKRLIISLLSAILLIPPLCPDGQTEPNDTQPGLTFQQEGPVIEWKVEYGEGSGDERRYFANPGPIRPTHAAELILHEEYAQNDRADDVLQIIRNSHLFNELSEAQRAFLDTDFGIWVENENPCKPHYFSTWLYAVSEADAKLTAQAYLDGLNEINRRNTERRKGFLADHQEKLVQTQGDLSKKQAELEVCQEQYEPVKKARHEFESDSGAYQSAVETITEMDKMLDSLEIELAGLRQKVQAVEKYRQQSPEPLAKTVRARLDEMFIELMIELTGLEARRSQIAMIRATEQRFLRLLSERDALRRVVTGLNEAIGEHKGQIEYHTRVLANPSLREQGPKVFQNTVVLHRVYGPNDIAETPRQAQTELYQPPEP